MQRHRAVRRLERFLVVALFALVMAPVAHGAVVWSADHETGDASQWDLGITHNWDDAACTFHNVVRTNAAIGNYSMRMTLGSPGGCRQAQLTQSQTNKTYTYAVSYFLPRNVTPTAGHWNVFQFKSLCSGCAHSDPFFTVDFKGNPLKVALKYKGGNYGIPGPFAGDPVKPNQEWSSTKLVPIKHWTRLEVYLDQSVDADNSNLYDGRIKVWLDGTLLFDLQNVRTGYDNGDMRWSVNNYSNGLSSYPYSVWIDNASISSVAALPPPPPPGEPAPIAGQGYTKVFGDEFSTLNRAVWDDHIWYDDPPDPAWTGFQSAENGVLHLRTSRNFFWGPGPNDNWPINTVTTHSSGRTFKYGYYEARMRWTKGAGAWPAFWLISQGWANTGSCATPAGELDVFEGQGTEPNVFYGTVHRNASGSCNSQWPDDQNGNNWQPTGQDLTAGFHDYGMLWEPGHVAWYLDGVKLMNSDSYYVTLDQPMMLLLQMWVGGWTSDPTSSTPSPLDTQVDWVHVWQN